MKKIIGLILSGISVFLFLGLPVRAQEATVSGVLAVPTISLSNDENLSGSSAERRSPMRLKSAVKAAYTSNEKVKIELFNRDVNLVELTLKNDKEEVIKAEVVENNSQGITTLTVNPPSEFEPGKYQMVVTDQTGQVIEQNFLWGVLAINPNKAIYKINETADLAMAVLNEQGKMVCDADIQLTVTSDQLSVKELLSTGNGKIIVNPECNSKDFTLDPDYEAEYKLGNAGVYKLELTAVTVNGTYTINDQVEVKNESDFEVERISATRIFPLNVYPMTINVVANKDFSGNIYEEVPASFEIIESGGTVTEENKNKKIVWKVDLKKGNKVSLGYKYKAPNVSPQFYLTGPLTMTTLMDLVYNESRQWQIAVDDVTNVAIRQEINIIDGSVTVGGTDAAIINIDTTKYSGTVSYYFEVIANQGAGTTLTVNLSTGNTNTVGIGITNANNVRVRKQFTPETGSFDYRLNLTTGTTPTVKVARVIIFQSAATITVTQTQIEIGNLEVGLSMATTTPMTSPKYWKYDESLWDGSKAFSAEVTYKAGVGMTAGIQIFTAVGVNTFTAPNGVTSVKVQAWGGGGAGGSSNTTTDGCGGGGGGAYSNKLSVAVVGGVGYTAFVGVGGTAKAAAKGGSGGASYFKLAVGTSVVSAAGGIGGTSQASSQPGAGGAGGLASAGVGDTKFDGGKGGIGLNNNTGQGGPGGSSAGVSEVGWSGPNPWSTLVASYGPTGSGIGGSGGGAGATGKAPGSGEGGGGGGAGDGAGILGGAGASGKVVVSWTAVDAAVWIYLQQDDGSFGGWTNVATILSGGTATVPTRVSVSGVNLTSGRNYRIVSMTGGGVAYNIYNAKIVVTQSLATSQSTYYFDGSDGISDPNGAWTDQGYAFDGSLDTWAYTASVGSTSTNYLFGAGVSCPTTGDSIGSVEARAYAYNDQVASAATVYTDGLGETLGVILASSYYYTQDWSDFVTLAIPNGGWTWQKLNDLEVKMYATVAQTGFVFLYRVELRVTTTAGTEITKLEPQYLLLNTKSTSIGTTLGYQTWWDLTEWSNTTNVYKHAVDSIGVGTSAQLVDINDSNAVVAGSKVMGTGQTISGSLTMPTTGHNIDTWLLGSGEVDASRILTQVVVNAGTTTTQGVSLDQLMRHGGWFSNGVRQPFSF